MTGHYLNEQQLATICKALSHPARISILKQLIREERCICGRIVEVMPLAQSTVSQHLKILKNAKLIMGELEGQKTCYCVDKNVLTALGATVADLVGQSPHNGRSL